MELTLDRLHPGCRGKVTAVDTDEALRARLRSFGLVPGTRVEAQYRSPGDHVTAIGLRGSVLALRTRDLRKIRVESYG